MLLNSISVHWAMHYADHTQRYNRMYLQTEFWRVTAADYWGEQKVISRIPEVLLFIWLRPVSSSKLVPPNYICQMCRGALLPCPLPTPSLQSSSIIEFMQIPLSRSSIQFSNQIPQKIFDYLDVNNRNYLFSKFLMEKICCFAPPPSAPPVPIMIWSEQGESIDRVPGCECCKCFYTSTTVNYRTRREPRAPSKMMGFGVNCSRV